MAANLPRQHQPPDDDFEFMGLVTVDKPEGTRQAMIYNRPSVEDQADELVEDLIAACKAEGIDLRLLLAEVVWRLGK